MCAASQKKSLAGLDSTQTDGVTAISSLEVVTSIVQKNDKTENQVKSSLLPYFLEYGTQRVGVFVLGGWAHSFEVSFFEGRMRKFIGKGNQKKMSKLSIAGTLFMF